MNERQTNQWVANLDGSRINALESAELDELLSNPKQQLVSDAVRALPQENVSLQWRSALNEKLRKLRPVREKISLVIIGFRALAGVGLASLVCIALYSKFGPQPNVSKVKAQTVASALIAEHRDSVASSEIAGPGIVDGEGEAKPASDTSDSTPADLEL